MNETLEHHGILGMKWGVRRYQNKDGTWTKEGKEHRAEGSFNGVDDYFKLSVTERVDSPIGKELLSGESYEKYASARDKQEEIENKVVSDKASDFYDTAHAVAEKYKAKAGENYNQETYDYYNEIGGIDAYDEILNEYARTNDEYGKARKDEADAVQSLYDEAGPLSKKYFGNEYRLTYQDVNELAYDRFDSDREKARRSGKIIDPVEAKKIFTQEELDYVLKRDVSDSRESEQNQLMVMEMLERSGIMDSISNKDFEKEVLRFEKDPHNYVAPTKDGIKHSDTVSDFLMHYGVKGQSWGKRNYQFEDGTLTEEGKKRYASDSGGVRGRRRTTNTVQGEDVHKTESVNQGNAKAPQMTQEMSPSASNHRFEELQGDKTNMMSDDEYTKTKQELAKRDFVQVYDGKMGKMIYVKKDEFRDHIRRLADQGIEVKMPYLDSSDKSDDSMSDIRMKNAEIRFWNELVEKAQSQTYTGPESEDILTKDDEKAKRKEIADRKAAIKAKVEEHRKKSPALMLSDEDEDSLMHYGILGMKWGIRRFQNKDGSLTSAGRKRYGDDIPDGNKSSDNSSDATPRTPAKSASEMTDQELSQALNRLRMEQQYNELTGAKSSNQYQNQQNFQSPPSNTNALSNAELQAYINRLDMEKRYAQLTAPPPKEVSAGQKFVKEVVGPAVNQVAKAFIVSALSKALGLSGDSGNNNNNNNNGGGKNKNNDGGQQKNYDKRFNETNSRIDKLANAVNNLANKSKQEANIVPAKSKNDRNSDDGADNNAMTPASNQSTSNTPRRDSIFAIARNTVRNAQDRWRANEPEREQKRQESREQRERRNASWSAFLTGLERQTGGGINPVTKSYETKAQRYFNSYLSDMSKKQYGKGVSIRYLGGTNYDPPSLNKRESNSYSTYDSGSEDYSYYNSPWTYRVNRT